MAINKTRVTVSSSRISGPVISSITAAHYSVASPRERISRKLVMYFYGARTQCRWIANRWPLPCSRWRSVDIFRSGFVPPTNADQWEKRKCTPSASELARERSVARTAKRLIDFFQHPPQHTDLDELRAKDEGFVWWFLTKCDCSEIPGMIHRNPSDQENALEIDTER